MLRRLPRPLNLWVVLDEQALWRPIDGPETMRGQIRHIMQLCGRPNVTVQIASPGASVRAAGTGRSPSSGSRSRACPTWCTWSAASAGYPVRRAEIERHWHVFNTLVTEAAPPERTPRILARLLATF